MLSDLSVGAPGEAFLSVENVCGASPSGTRGGATALFLRSPVLVVVGGGT